MSKYCDYEKDSFFECINKDPELFDYFIEAIVPNIKIDRLYKEKLNKNKLELIKVIEHYLSYEKIFEFTIDLELLKEDVIEISEKYNLYWDYNMNYDKYYFISKGENK